MIEGFNQSIAIITGGASGLGAALAKELVSSGARVVIADSNFEKASIVADSLGATAEAVHVDVSQSDQIESLIQKTKAKYGTLDLMVNNAGISCYGEMIDLPLSEWTRVLEVNLWGVIAGSIAAYKVMAQQGSGRIVNLGSMATFIHDPLFGPYVTSKCGVVGFSRVLASEAEAHGVRVSVVCPGSIRTPMLNDCEPSKFTPSMPPPEAARRILEAVARNRRIIVFPFYARVLWWLDRINSSLLNPLRREILRRARQRQAQQQSVTRA